MDKRIEKKKLFGSTGRLIAAAAVGIVSLGGLYAIASTGGSGQSQKVSLGSLTTSKVSRGQFNETLSVRGTLTAKSTIYLDAIAGGIVEEKIVEKGAFVQKDQPLLRLANTNLQLEVITREAQIAEQINFLRNNQLLAESSRLQLRTDILENENQIKHLQEKVDRAMPLIKSGLLPKNDMTTLQIDLAYYKNRNEIAKERQRQEEAIRARQLEQLQESADRLQKNLSETRKVLDDLVVKAPVSGYLSELTVELGESKTPGARLGQIDVPGSYKVVASLDEFYLSQVSIGMTADVALNGRKIEAKVSKIDGRVNNAKFTVEIDMPDDLGDGIKVGQGLDLDIVLGAGAADAVLLQRGAFFNDTGGNWVFVLQPDGRSASRRAVKLSERNKDYFRVASGLQAGEVVVISGYSAFDKADTLILN